MADIKVTADLSKLGVFLNSITEKAVKKAVRKSIQNTFRGIRTDVMKEINKGKFYDKKTLPSAKAKQKYFDEKKNLKSGTELTDMWASLRISSEKLDLIKFFAKPVLTGYSSVNHKALYGVSTNVLGNRKIVPRAFIGFKGKSNAQVFRRTGKKSIATKGRYAGQLREQIKRLQGPSMSTLFRKTNAAERIQNEANERMSREMSTNLNYYLNQL